MLAVAVTVTVTVAVAVIVTVVAADLGVEGAVAVLLTQLVVPWEWQ